MNGHAPMARSRQTMQDIMGSPEVRAARRKHFPYSAFALAIVALRGRYEFTQSELANRIGTTQSAVSRAESGKHAMSAALLQRIADAFDCDVFIEFRQREQA